jgi:hypothetical protein
MLTLSSSFPNSSYQMVHGTNATNISAVKNRQSSHTSLTYKQIDTSFESG